MALALLRLVVKTGGEILATGAGGAGGDGDPVAVVARSLVALRGAGHDLLVVHGGGPQASALQKQLGLAPRLVGGRRVTDAATLDVMKMIVAGRLNVDFCARLAAAGLALVGLHGGGGLVRATRRPPRVVSGGGSEPVDFGLVGDVTGFDLALLELLLDAGRVPVIASLASDGEGGVLNVNADTLAAALAVAVAADTLVLVTSTAGVLADVGDPRSRLPRLSASEARAAIADGRIGGGMIPKVEESLAALRAGARQVVVVGQLGEGELERAVLEPGSAGTLIVA